MASETGGRADKLGNEFELLWLVRHLVELVAGRAHSVHIEALGDDEKGTEFWVCRPDSTREAHQCKRENGSAGKWSFADLAAERVISYAKLQLERNPSHRFIFVSGDKAPLLSDLCERSQRCGTVDEFLTNLVATSRKHKSEFVRLCSSLELDQTKGPDLERALDFLRRFRPRVVDKNAARDEVEDLAGRWFTGDPKLAVAHLKDLASNSLGHTLYVADVVKSLPAEIRLRDLAGDLTLYSALQALRERYDRSYRHLLIGGALLGRPETDKLHSLLFGQAAARLILLHGPGGEGKSGVIFELIERLKADDVPYLPLRLDRDRPGDSPSQFGHALDLPGSPAACLAAEAGDRKSVLVLDQVDAIRWATAHSSHAWDTCERVIDEALRTPNMRVVIVCRTFDVEDDPRVRAWKQRPDVVEARVGPLDDATVDAIVKACGVDPSGLDGAQRRVLRSAQGLYLWRSLHESGDVSSTFRTLADLMRAYWVMIRKRLAELRPGNYTSALDALVSYMDRQGTLTAPGSVCAPFALEVNVLASLNVLSRSGDRVLFAHQSYLDYLTAERLLGEIHTGSGTVLGWLQMTDQSLFRRAQLRQVLTLLRDESPGEYVSTIGSILFAGDVRFHLKHLVLQVVGSFDPPIDGEVGLILELLNDEHWVDHVFGTVLAGRVTWFDLLYERNMLQEWITRRDGWHANLAINLAERVVETRCERLERLILGTRDEGRETRVDSVLWRSSPERLSPSLFDAYVERIRNGSLGLRRMVNWKSVAKADPHRCLVLLEARVDCELRDVRTALAKGAVGPPPDGNLLHDAVRDVAAAAVTIPTEAWDSLIPRVHRLRRLLLLIRRTAHRRAAEYDFSLYESQTYLRRLGRDLTAILRAAGDSMAATNPDAFWIRVIAGPRKHFKPVTRLLAHGLVSGPDVWGDKALGWLLQDERRLSCGSGERGAVYRPAMRLLRRFAGLCSVEVFAELLKTILRYRSEHEKRMFMWRHKALLDQLKHEKSFDYDALEYSEFGLGQRVLLAALPHDRLTTDATDWLGVLRRKFGMLGPLVQRRPRVIGGSVTSTIPRERLERITDRHWLGLTCGDLPVRPHRLKPMGPGLVGESSVEMFAADLSEMAGRQPRRFAALALQMPKDADSRYVVAIFSALGSACSAKSESEPADRESTGIAEFEAVLNRFAHLAQERYFASALCSAIKRNPSGGWSDATLGFLAHIAIGHDHPAPGEFTVFRSPQPGDAVEDFKDVDVVSSSINCVRGAACEAIQSVLFEHPGKLPLFNRATEALTHDPHPAVRVASIGLSLPLYNIDRDASVGTFLTACSHADDRVLMSRHLSHFVRYAIANYAEEIRPLIERMVRSPVNNVAKTGAQWVGVAWGYREWWNDLFEICLAGTALHREGIAESLAHCAASENGLAGVTSRLAELFEDSEKPVRDAAASVFRLPGTLDTPDAVSVVHAFVTSAAVDDNVDDLLAGLERHQGRLRPFAPALRSLVKRFTGPLAAEARDHRTRRPLDAGTLAKVLLRLYGQSEGDGVLRNECLDAWDRLLSERIGFDVLRQIDA